VNGFATKRLDGERFSDHRRRQEADAERRLGVERPTDAA